MNWRALERLCKRSTTSHEKPPVHCFQRTGLLKLDVGSLSGQTENVTSFPPMTDGERTGNRYYDGPTETTFSSRDYSKLFLRNSAHSAAAANRTTPTFMKLRAYRIHEDARFVCLCICATAWHEDQPVNAITLSSQSPRAILSRGWCGGMISSRHILIPMVTPPPETTPQTTDQGVEKYGFSWGTSECSVDMRSYFVSCSNTRTARWTSGSISSMRWEPCSIIRFICW